MEIAPRVSVDPNVCHGAPVIGGTRVLVSVVIGSLASRMDRDEVRREYGITDADIDAALAYAADLVTETGVVPLVGAVA